MMAHQRYQAGLAPDDLRVRDCGASNDHGDGEGAAPSDPAGSGSNAASDQADEGVPPPPASRSDQGGNSDSMTSSGERSAKKPSTAATVTSVTADVAGQRATPDRNPAEREALPQSGNGESLARKDALPYCSAGAPVSEAGGTGARKVSTSLCDVAGVDVVEPGNSGSRVKSDGDESRGGAGGDCFAEVGTGSDRPRVQEEGDTLAWRTGDEGQKEEKKTEPVEVRGKKRAIDEASV